MDKDYILGEIKRTAKANRGMPLGQQRLFAETGIKQSDWFGKYWPRWSDALREAGFAPNKLQGAYDRSEVLNKYATLAQELGRLPTKGDLRLKARTDAEFPNDKTFQGRATKSEFVRVLLDHCRSRSGYENVARMCEEYANAHRPEPSESATVGQAGFVYLIKSGRFYKIGKTNAAGRREYELDIQLPESVKTIHVIRTDDPGGIEAYWHKRFGAKRKKGEWFKLTAVDITAFKRRKFM